MITLDKIHTYKKYHGDIDMFARTGSSKEKTLISEQEWSEIEQLLQDLTIVRQNLASEEFESALRQRIALLCDSEETIVALKSMSDKP